MHFSAFTICCSSIEFLSIIIFCEVHVACSYRSIVCCEQSGRGVHSLVHLSFN